MKTETARLKAARILKIYTDLINGEVVSKNEAVEKYGVSPRTIQRDIDNIRSFLAEQPETDFGQIVHSKKMGGYVMKYSGSGLSDEEISILFRLIKKTAPVRRKELLTAIDKLLKEKQEEAPPSVRSKAQKYRKS